MPAITLEICCFNNESALIAQNAGANRIELCSGPAEGGATPGPGIINITRKIISIPVFVMIRPRGGDFFYSENEYETMLQDIEFAKNAGADGVVFGILKPDGTVDIERTARLAEVAHPMEVTFHRAFDMTADPFRALEDIISTGARRILTSGQKPKAIQGADLISALVKQAGNRISIMAGSGINDVNVLDLMTRTGVQEVHLSAKKYFPSKMLFQNSVLSMGKSNSDEYQTLLADGEMIRKIRLLIDQARH